MLGAPYSVVQSILRDGALTVSLDSLCQCLTTLWVKNFSLTSSLYFPSFRLDPFLLVTSLLDRVASFHTPPSPQSSAKPPAWAQCEKLIFQMRNTPTVHRSPREPLVPLCPTTGLWDGHPIHQAELHVASPTGPQQDLQCAECCLSRASPVDLQLWKAGLAKSKAEGNPDRQQEANARLIAAWSHACIQTAGARPSKSRSWHSPGIWSRSRFCLPLSSARSERVFKVFCSPRQGLDCLIHFVLKL